MPPMTDTVRSVRLSFAIMRLLAEAGQMTLSEVGKALDLSPSSCLNLLRTLVDEGAVRRDAQSKRYRLAGNWAASNLFHDNRAQAMLDRMRPSMAAFARDHGSTVGLWMVAPGRRLLLVGHCENEAPLRIQLAEGQRQPLGGGAVGKALASAQSVASTELARRHAEVRWQTPISFADYADDVARAATAGYAIDDGVAFAGVCSVAAVVDREDAEFLLSSSVFSGSRSAKDLAGMGHALADLARSSG